MVPGHSVRRCQVEPPRVYCHVFTWYLVTVYGAVRLSLHGFIVTCLHGTWSQCTALSGWASTGSLSRVYMVPGHSVRLCQAEPTRVYRQVLTWYLVTVYGAVRLSLHGFIVTCLHGTWSQCTALSGWASTGSCHVFTWYLVTVYGAVRLSLHGFIVTCLHGTWSQCTALSGWASTGLLSRFYMVPGHSVRRC